MNSTPAHPHQVAPLVFINGRSGMFAGDCSSTSTTGVLLDRLRHAHHMDGLHLTYPRTHAYHWWSEAFRELVSSALHSQIDRYAHRFQVDVVAHSMGCDVVREIMDSSPLPVFRRVVLIAPAMSRRVNWHRRHFDKMLVLHNRKDGAILAGSLIPGHPYGMAGRRGFRTDDPRIRQMEMSGSAKVAPLGHGHYFREPFLTQVAGLVKQFLTK